MPFEPISLYLSSQDDYGREDMNDRPYSYKTINPPGLLEIEIFNATDFEDWWLRQVIHEYAKRAGINWKIYFWFVEEGWSEISGETSDWMGTSNTFDEFICQVPTWLEFPIVFEQFDFINRRELCRFIIAHELCHATYGHPENFPNDMIDSEQHIKMENRCNEFAAEVIKTGVI